MALSEISGAGSILLSGDLAAGLGVLETSGRVGVVGEGAVACFVVSSSKESLDAEERSFFVGAVLGVGGGATLSDWASLFEAIARFDVSTFGAGFRLKVGLFVFGSVVFF